MANETIWNGRKLTDWLPTSKKEMELRGWECADIILFTGDAYVDHPSFGASVIGRILEKDGFKVAIVPQPNWRDDLRDFKKLGKPRLFFGVTSGNMDSMVNHYTANKRLRSDDAYTAGAGAGFRPDYATIVYSNILKKIYPDVPVIIGGIEASLRRLTHFDYWKDKLLPSILIDSKADILVYGLGEKTIRLITKELNSGKKITELKNIPQTSIILTEKELKETKTENTVFLFSHEECLADKRKFAENFKIIETESNKLIQNILVEKYGDIFIKVNPAWETPTVTETDEIYNLPYTRLPHLRYKDKGQIPAFEMIKFSVNIHRGCFGGCSFCTISAHQGKFIASRSENSIMNEVENIIKMPDFKGYLSDVGGPTANMYKMKGIKEEICNKCQKPSCIYPSICSNLNTNHQPLIDLYERIKELKGIKKAFIGSGIRYDMFFDKTGKMQDDKRKYAENLIRFHVSGRLKVAPEHSQDKVLEIMRKPSFSTFQKFNTFFQNINSKYELKQQLIPYFISSHPACTDGDMAELALETKQLDFKLEQIQDFTPTPLTLSSVLYYAEYNPYTKEKIVVANTKENKTNQRQFFFWYKPEYRKTITTTLLKINKKELINKILSNKKY